MARKSAEKRIADTSATIEAYENAGFVDDYRVRFMKDMMHRLQAGRGISSKQRNWLDSLHSDGAPEKKGDPILLERIEAALEVFKRDTRATEALTSFKTRIVSGKKMSEKQDAFLNSLLEKAEDIKENGHYRPSQDVINDLKIACAVIRARINWISANKPGTYKAYEKISSWMVSEDLLSSGSIDENLFVIDEWAVNKVLDAGKVAIREIKNPKFPVGTMCFLYDSLVLVSSEPTVEWPNFTGHPAVDVLINGQIQTVEVKRLSKRKVR